MLMLAGISVSAQVGPYAAFESVPNPLTSSTVLTFSTTPAFTRGTTANTIRSGAACIQNITSTTGMYFETAVISKLKNFSFYIKKNTGINQMAYKVEFFVGSTPYDVATQTTYPNVVKNSFAPLPFGAPNISQYQLVSITFPNDMPDIKIRVSDNRVAGDTGGIYIDDISWDRYKSDGSTYAAGTGYPDNTVVVPIQNGAGTPTANPGGTINIASGEVYNFYDNGGSSDSYNFSQSNVVTFKPTTAGEKARITFNSYTGAAGEYIEVFYGPTAGAVGTGALYHTAATSPGTPTWVSTATDGEITVRFVSDAATNAAGFYITADISPCAAISSASLVSVNPTDATVSWTTASPVPANYDIYYSTNPTPPVSGTTPNLTVSGSLTSYLIPSLSSNTTYYVWVRTRCSSTNFGSWTATAVTFTTPCAAANVTYTQDFSSAVAPAIPSCNTTVTASGTTGSWVTSATNGAGYGFSGNVARFSHGSGTADAWYMTQAINMVNTKTYRLTFTYSNTTTNTENLRVAIGTSNTALGMATQLAAFNSINVGTATTYWVDFIPATNAAYYVGFQSYGPSGSGWILLDDIVVAETTCFAPSYTSFTASPVSPSTATLNWSAPASGTPTGYQYYISNVNTPPTFYTVPTGNVASGTSIAITGLTPGTNYYFWIRSNCGSGNYSSWSSLTNPGTFTTTTITNVSMSNTTITNCGVNFYDSAGSAANYANDENFTQTFVPSTANSKIKVVFSSFATEARFDFLRIYDGPNNTYPLLGTFSGTQITAGQAFVSTAPNGELTFNFTSDFSNRAAGWAATVTCVTVPKINSFTPSSICAGTSNTTVTLTGMNFTGVTSLLFNTTSVSFTVVNDTTITAIVPPSVTTGEITIANSQASTSSATNFVVNALPTALTITPSSAARCQSDAPLLLTATGGIVPNISVINENFNGTAAGWTRTNASTGGTPANAAWLTRPNGYNPGGFSGVGAMSSNDGSQFIISNSDSQGSGSTTNVTLTSPVFSLVGFTQASVSFYHYYKAWTNGSATVEIYNGSSWVVLQSWTSATQGTATNFKFQSYNLSAYLGTANLQIRFRYNTDWGYVWAIDNFLVSGSSGTGVTWSSVPSGSPTYPDYSGLYTNAAGTIAYTGAAVSSVYTAPSATTTYYVTSTSVANCSTSTTVAVSVTPIAAGVASSDQSICGGAPASLTLTGSSGNIQWQYADNFGFTFGVTPIPGATSATLTSAQMGVITANRFYRAVITNGSCTVYSNVVSIVTSLSTTTWNGTAWSNGLPNGTKAVVFNGPYTSDPLFNTVSPGDITACNVYVTSAGSVTFIPGHTLTVNQTINVDSVNGGSLVFENGASLHQPNDVTNASGVYSGGNSGSITYKRTATPMYKMDYTYWSSPVYPQNILSLSPLSPLFYYYDGVTANAWQNMTPSTTNMGVARGYLIRAPSNFPVYTTPFPPTPQEFTANFSGVPNSGTQSIQIGVAQGINQFNLLGNPYPSTLLADSFISANPNVGALYFWTHNNNITQQANGTYQYTNDDYAIYTLAGGTGTQPSGVDGAGNNTQPDGYIGSGQGFFTKGVATITGSGPNYYATFTNSMRTSGHNGNFFRTNGPTLQNTTNSYEKHRYWLDIANTQGAFREVLISYIETATMGIDRLFDAEMSATSTNVISLYTMVENKNLAIQGRPLPFEDSDTVPLAYKSTIASTYTISMPRFDGLFTAQHVYLEDRLLNVIHDLTNSPYSFVTEIGTFENRFVLRYTNQTLGNQDPVFNDSSLIVYKKDSTLFIETGNIVMNSVSIYDIRGREIAVQKSINSNTASFNNLPSTQQVLLVKVKDENGIVITKKVVY